MIDETPVGIISHYIGLEDDLPDKWLIMKGQSLLCSAYAELYTLLVNSGVVSATESSTFTLPNASGRFLLGKADAGTGSTLGGTGGTLEHTHTTHATHSSDGGHTHDAHPTVTVGGTGVNTNPRISPVTHSTDGAHTHNAHDAHTAQAPPFIAMYTIIKARP